MAGNNKGLKERVRGIYGWLIGIPIIGPAFRGPVRLWRWNKRRRRAWSAPDEVLSLVVAGLDGLRQDFDRTRSYSTERNELFSASISTLGEKLTETRALIDGATSRVEFVRAELMFEIRAKLAGASPAVPGYDKASPPIEPKFITYNKLTQKDKEGQIRLNIGCGHVPLEGYINSDVRELPGVDLVADVSALPFESETLSEIHCAHLLEHFPVQYLSRVLLPHWRTRLKPGGLFQAIVPDTEAMIADFHGNQMSFEDLREVTYGLQEYEGDFHFNMFSRESLKVILSEAGFGQIEYEFTGRKNGKCRDMKISAVRI